MKAKLLLLLAIGSTPAFGGQTFSNPQPIQLPAEGAASHYPSIISVSGFTGLLQDVSVTLSNVSHESLADLTALLVGPHGRAVQIFSLVGTSREGNPPPFTGATWTLDDRSTNWLYGTSASGIYLPTAFSFSAGLFPAPAPQEFPSSRLAAFRGINPNGDWSLYLYDKISGNGGSVDGGWSLNFEPDPMIAQTAFNPNTILISSAKDGFSHGADPYPSTLAVSGLTGIISKVTVTLSNLYHGSGHDLHMLLVAPGGEAVEFLGAASEDDENINSETMTFDDGAATPIESVWRSGTYQPTVTQLLRFGLPEPAPPPPYATRLSAFRGAQPNGTWSLYIYDDIADHSGVLNGGWSVRIESGFILSVTLVGNQVKISWPQSAQGYRLQSSPRLDSPEWINVTAPIIPEGPNYRIQEPAAGTSRFYRLFKP